MIRAAMSLAFLAAAVAPAEACRWTPWRFYWGQTSDAAVTLSSRAPCATRINSSGTAVDQVRVIERATHGVAGVSTVRVAYAPRKGYVGADRFVFEVYSATGPRGTPATARVRVNVTVTP